MEVSTDDIELAEKILVDYVWAKKTVLLPKNGSKLNKNEGSKEEKLHLKSYHHKQNKHISFLKTGKLKKLGLVQWMPQLQVAKIIKQGKFIQRMGQQHLERFLFLFSEEVLFLLDNGDIELTYEGSLLSFKDAYTLLTCAERKSKDELLCTINEYKVFAWLSKEGFVLQRQYIPPNLIYQKPLRNDIACTSLNVKLKENQKKLSKKRKRNHSSEYHSTKRNISSLENRLFSQQNVVKKLWDFVDFQEVESLYTDNEIQNEDEIKIEFLSFDTFKETVIIPEISGSMITNGRKIEKKVLSLDSFQPITKDERSCWEINCYKNDNKELFKIAQNSHNWTSYKTKISQYKIACDEEYEFRSRLMQSGSCQSLIKPDDVLSSKDVLNKLKIFNYKDTTSSSSSQDLGLIYNVFKKGGNIHFRKTKPGKPFCQVRTFNFYETTKLNLKDFKLDSDVPLKVAAISPQNFIFFQFDKVDIPDYLTFP